MSAYYGECCWTGSTRSLLSITYKRKSSVGQNGKQLLKHKPPFRAVLQIIHNWLVGLYKGRQEIMDFQRPDSISGSLPPSFQLTRLIQVSNIYNWRGFFPFFPAGRKKGVEGFATTAFSLMASTGFLPVRRVTSPFRAETTAGSRTTHSEDLWPSGSPISTAHCCLDRRSARLSLSTIAWSR